MIQLRTNSKNKERSICRIIIKQKSFLLILQKYQSTFIVSCALYWSDNDYVKTLESAGKKVCYLKSVFLFRKKKNKKFSNSDLKTKSFKRGRHRFRRCCARCGSCFRDGGWRPLRSSSTSGGEAGTSTTTSIGTTARRSSCRGPGSGW